MPEKPQRRQRSPRTRILRTTLLLLAGITIGATADHFIPAKLHGIEIAAELGTPVQPGPWGELYRAPFTIAAPDELLPVRSIESGGTHWFFKNFVPSQLSRLLDSADLPAEQRDALLGPEIAHATVSGVELTPSPEMVVALPDKAREVIYRQLAQFPENRSSFYFIHKTTLVDRFTDSRVSHGALSLFHKLSCEHGEYLVFGGLPALLAQLPDYGEKLRFMKALTRQKTMLVRLRVTKDSDLSTLAGYWGKGCWAPNIRALLESIQRVPGGTFTSLLAILPPMPAGEAYFYPIVQNNPMNGPGPIRDCHWTSLNFFHDTPDPQSSSPEYFCRELAANYYPIAGDPRYGDVLVMTKPDGDIVHSAVFMADEIVFTKNGSTAIYPWMFATVPDLLKQYSFLAPQGQQLTLRYFRNKGV